MPIANEAKLPLAGTRICYLSTIAISTSRIVNRQCHASACRGASVTLISPNPEEGSDGAFTTRSYRTLRGPFGKLLSSPMIIVPALQERSDVYHVHTFQLLPIAILLKVLFRKCVVYDMFEDFPSMVMTREWKPLWLRKAASGVISVLQRTGCRTLDAIVTADPAVLRQYRNAGIASRKTRGIVFYNFPTLDLFQGNIVSSNMSSSKCYDIVYSGGMSERTGMFVLLGAVEHMVAAGLRPRVLMYGYTDTSGFVPEFLKKAAEKGVEQCFDILGRVPHEQVPLLLSEARIGVVPLQPIPKFLKNIPTKLFEFWACGLPVVASNLPPIKIFFREGLYGHLVDPGDARQFADALIRLLSAPDLAQWMGKQAQQAVLARFNAVPEQQKLFRLYAKLSPRRV